MIFPFILLYLFRTYGVAKSAVALVISAVVAIAFVGPFLLWSASDFTSSMFSSLDNKANQLILSSVNLSYFVFQLIPLRYLKIVQGIVLVGLFYLAWQKMKSLTDYYWWTAVALLAFILLNSFIDAYFYFFIFFLAILHAVAVWHLNQNSDSKPFV